MIYRACLFMLFLLVSTIGFSQQLIQGTVTSSEDNEPVIGASITVKGNPGLGTVTDIDGHFKLQVPEGSKFLLFSYIGMKPQEVAIKPVLTIVMQPDAQQLEEVVVTGMQRIDKRLFTGATSKIDAGKAKIDGLADISRSLEGRAAGVTAQNVSGTFGAAPKIRVRGATSIYGNSRPLWVVDGIVMEDNIEISSDDLSSGNAETLISSAVAGLNADDIESIQILKDGSATSIYGARAMSGVVVVTTKKGKAGQSRLSYTGEFTVRLRPTYREFNITNSQEQMGIYKEMEEKGWLEFTKIDGASNSGVYGKMYELVNQYLGGDEYALRQRDAEMNAFLRKSEFINTDWFGLLFDQSLQQTHSLSFNTGTEKSTFYTSLSALNDPGWSKASAVERYTLNVKASYNISPSLTLNMLGSGSNRKQKAPGTSSRDVDVVSGKVNRSFDINPYSYALNTSRTLDPDEYYRKNFASFNIYHELENNYIDLDVKDVKLQGDLTWKVLKGWDVTALGAIRYMSSQQEHHIKDRSNQAMAYRAGVEEGEGGVNETIRGSNRYLYRDPDDLSALPETILPKGGIYELSSNNLKSVDFRLSSNYATNFRDVHVISLFGGMEANSTERGKTWFRGWGYQYDKGGSPFYDYMAFKQGKEEGSDYYSRTSTLYLNTAFFATGTYSYQGKYTLSGTTRYEGTNKLGKSRSARWLPTWNVSGAWNAHEEGWFKNETLSHGTLRLSYSLAADRGPAWVTNSLPVFVSNTPWRPFASVLEPGIVLDDPENSLLTYEKKYEFNAGVDLGFFNDRLSFTGDVYRRNQFDLIGEIYTIGVGGGTSLTESDGGNIRKYANSATMKSSGVELAVFAKNIVTKDFQWSTDFIFSKSVNEITALDSHPRVIDLVRGNLFSRRAGYPVGALFSIPFAGLNDEGLPTFINEKGEETISDINFQENTELDFLKYEGQIDPTLTGSLTNTLAYKGFRLNVFVTYAFGNVVRLDPVFSDEYSDLDAMPKEFKNRWVNPGDEKITTIPVIASRRQAMNISSLDQAYNAYNYSTERIAKGDFIRLKDVSLSYDLPKKWTNAIRFGDISLKLMATNLFLLYADKKLNGQDPEFYNSGGVANPLPKQFTLTIRMGL
ncbi:MAG: SusC/RagA family TonB-linked outer membrane protein [Tannerellaceae bacterium]|jgi:TonB-linked SusC/RagA family outer membrane protein|nr:SusC/RagA family TonB-linked outer membrane protein [Tannerellaceae bacterium]